MPDESHPAVWQDPEVVAHFLQNVRGAIPLAIEQIDIMLRLVGAARGERMGRFLDLGCGDGILSAALLDEYPEAQGWLLAPAEPMLASARGQLREHAGRLQFLEGDLAKPGWTEKVRQAAPFDAIVSGLAIYHLPHERKRQLYGELFQLLKPEGIFINIEHVASATRWTESLWNDYMIDAIFGHALQSSPGKSRAEVAREYYGRPGAGANVLAPLEVQCDWLREIGFENVDCYLKVLELAVFGGQKPSA
jgi:SAM-dependent methyltransferase